jgi:hypothetical protein
MTDEPVSLQPRPGTCAALTTWSGLGTGGNCQASPIVETQWRFLYPTPHVSRLLLCAEHRAQLAFRDQYLGERALEGVSVGPLYDASVED